LAGGKKVWWGDESAQTTAQAGRNLGTRVGPLPAPGAWSKLSVPLADIGLKPGQAVASVSLQEYGGIAYWDAAAPRGGTDRGTAPGSSLRVWWRGLTGKAPPGLPAGLEAVVAGGPGKTHPPEAMARLRAFYLAYVARPIDDNLAARQQEWERARA